MSPIPTDTPASPAKPVSPDHHRGGQATFKALLLLSTMLSGGLMALPADAGSLLITTTGTIVKGTETDGLFGLLATSSLAGDPYTLAVFYDGLGSNYNAGGGYASDVESFPGTAGYVTATVNGISLTMPLTNSLGSILEESLVAGFGSLNASNNGYNGAASTGSFVTVSQNLVCGSSNSCVPAADLMTPFFYSLIAGDSGTDQFTFEGAGFPTSGTPTATFVGTESSMNLQIPEPTSLAILGSALGLFGLRRRRFRRR
jgi:hypothetical protein